MITFRKLILVIFLLSAPGFSQASLLAGWDVDGVDLNSTGASGIDNNSTSAPYTFSAGTLGTNVGSATLTLGSGVNPTTSANQYGFKIPGGDEQTTLSGAITENHFIQFEIAAATGFYLNLSSLEFTGQSSGTGADNVALLSSVDGFNDSSSIASLAGISDTTGGFDTDSSGFGGPIDVSASQYQNLNSISFRLYGWNTSSGAGITYLRNLSGDDIEILGTVTAIPEVSTILPLASLLVLGLSVYTLKRRRKLLAAEIVPENS